MEGIWPEQEWRCRTCSALQELMVFFHPMNNAHPNKAALMGPAAADRLWARFCGVVDVGIRPYDHPNFCTTAKKGTEHIFDTTFIFPFKNVIHDSCSEPFESQPMLLCLFREFAICVFELHFALYR